MPPSLTKDRARDTIFSLLSPAELQSVAEPRTKKSLAAGQEYLDLEEPLIGAQRSHESRAPAGRILTRSGVHAETWQRILAVIAEAKTSDVCEGENVDAGEVRESGVE